MNLHELFSLQRPLFIFDTETTGVDPKTDRIVEIGFQMWTAEGMMKEWRSLVNPGVPIPPSATKVHGITDAAVVDSMTFAQLAPSLAKGFSACDFGGKNVRFDLRITAAEMRRAGVEWSYSDARIVDIDRLEQLAVPRDLGSMHEKYAGAKHEGAHGALSDVRASTTVIGRQLEVHPNLPRNLDQLHEAQWPGWLCDGGEFRTTNGVPTCNFGKHKGKAMIDVPRGYWDWLLGQDFAEDVKALARNAKLGKFPPSKQTQA